MSTDQIRCVAATPKHNAQLPMTIDHSVPIIAAPLLQALALSCTGYLIEFLRPRKHLVHQTPEHMAPIAGTCAAGRGYLLQSLLGTSYLL